MPTSLTAQRLREVLTYDAETGQFRWRVTLSRSAAAGKVAGCKHRTLGCIYIGIGGRLHKAHRLVWLYVHGVWPAKGIDHINGDHADNRIANLRETSQAENMQNLWRPHRDNRSGFMGVYQTRGKFVAKLKAGPYSVQSVKFLTAAEAHACYLQIKAGFHPFGAVAAA